MPAHKNPGTVLTTAVAGYPLADGATIGVPAHGSAVVRGTLWVTTPANDKGCHVPPL